MNKYQRALQSKRLDSAACLLLTVKVLSMELGGLCEIKNIQQAFVDSNYARVKTFIDEKLIELEVNNSDLADVIREALVAAEKNDSPEENLTRRYFDTKVSIHTWNSLSRGEFNSLDKLAHLMSESSDKPLDFVVPSTTLDNAAGIVSKIREFGESKSDIVSTMGVFRNEQDSVSNIKDRGGKRIDTNTSTLYSLNPGIVKASSPMPFNERLEEQELHEQSTKTARNKVTDLYNIDPTVERGFSKNNKIVPYVNSVSGTTFTMVAVLNKYAKSRRCDPTYAQDINNIVKAFLAFTCMQGYHSLAEMAVVLQDRKVQEFFAEEKIELELFPLQPVEEAFNEATEYAINIYLKNILNEEVMAYKNKIQSLMQGGEDDPTISPFNHKKSC